jgi:hypothetical protein
MSAPVTDLTSSSISSSGHVDGLGRRSLSFDRETGAIRERVHVRPELAAFEQILRERVEHLSTLEEERFARPSAVERDPATGELVVVGEFIAGSRLCELLEVSADASAVPGVDVALGFLLEALPALSALHTGSRVIHGLIDPSRTVVTADGQVVILDVAFGSAVARLNLSRQRLWSEFGVWTSPGEGSVVFDATGDVTQAALCALMLVLGRNLLGREYPEALPSLLMEVIEVAHIRGSTSFASGLQRFLQRSLPLPGRRPYASAQEALADVRQLVQREIGLDVCRHAIVEFVAQMDAAFATAGVDEPSASAAHETDRVLSEHIPELDQFLEPFGADEGSRTPATAPVAGDHDDNDLEEMEITFDQAEPPAVPQQQHEEEQQEHEKEEDVYDLPAFDDPALSDPVVLSSEFASFENPPPTAAPSGIDDASPALELEVEREQAFEPEVPAVPPPAEPAPAQAPVFSEPETAVAERPSEFLEFAAAEPSAAEADATEPESETEPEPEKETASSRRRKRQQQKSARARKDKLRSTTADQKVIAPAPAATPPPPERSGSSGWQVSPPRPTVPEPLIPAPPSVPQPRPIPPAAQAPAMPSFAPTLVGPVPQPSYASQPGQSSVYGAPSVARPQPPPPPPVPPAVPPVQTGHLKIKVETPATFSPKRLASAESTPVYSPPDRFSTLSLGRAGEQDAPRAFPWKLAAIAVVVAIVAIGVGRSYLPGRPAVAGEPGAQVEPESSAAASASAADGNADKAATPIPAGQGRVNIQTQPAGIKVLLDRKPVGETPLLIDAAPGRRVLTFLTSGGEVLHSVRVVAGKTVTLDIPVFSGWVAVFAPIVLDISEDGRRIGTTEQSRLILPPGRHELTLSNTDLGYSIVREVHIEPGGVRSVTVDPKGTANLNAIPWAEVWLDGTKLGDTPLSSTEVRLGLREFVFKHPELGERRVAATIRANSPAAVSVDFTK